MKQLEVSRKAIKVIFDGVEYIVKKPSTAQVNEFRKYKSPDAQDDNSLEKTIELLESLGLPSKVSWELDIESLTDIIKAIIPQKIDEKKS